MKKYIYSILYLTLATSLICCSNKKQIEENNVAIFHKSIQLKNDILGKPGPCILIGNNIIGIDYRLDSCFFCINTQNDSIYRFGSRGNGPNEFISPLTLQYIDKNHFGSFDFNLGEYTRFKINNKNINIERRYKVINNEISASFDFKQISNNSYLGFGPYKEDMYIILDSLANLKSSFFEIPYKDKDEKSIANNVRAMAYQGRLNLNPTRNKFIYTSIWGDIIHIYNISNDKIDIITKIENIYPSYIPQQDEYGYSAPLYSSNIVGCISSTTTEKYIYLLCSNEKIEKFTKEGKEFCGKIVRIYDWHGNKVQSFILDLECSNICVSQDDKMLYAIADNPDPELVLFDLTNKFTKQTN